MSESSHSILIIAGRFGIGGVERVSVTLANAFVRRGDRVCVVAYEFEKEDLLEELDDGVAVEELSFPAFTRENAERLRELMSRRGIDVIMNQWAMPYAHTRMLRKVMPRGCKLIAVHHTMPGRSARITATKNPILRSVWRIVLGVNAHLVYLRSNAYVVLSESYIPIFRRFAWLASARKICAIGNPTMMEHDGLAERTNTILYVGRLSNTEKRVDRIIDVWRAICGKLPDWELKIVGDGPDRAELERRAEGLPRVIFLGFQKTKPHYEGSKMLFMTSNFEGLSLVLIESMVCGCIPVVLDSFPAAHDVIDGSNGVLVSEPFDVGKYGRAVCELAANRRRLEEMSHAACLAKDKFGVTAVLKKWDEVFRG